MAAATASTVPTIDLKTQSSYPLRLGTSLLRPSEAKKFASVRYNHRPGFRAPRSVHTSLVSVSKDGDEELIVRDSGDDYRYLGKNVGGDGWYVLTTNGSGTATEIVLEKLDSSHEFNLTETPSENDSAVLVDEFPQLSFDDRDGLLGDGEAKSAPADPNDPFDYRNHLKPSTLKAVDRAPTEKARASAPPPAAPPRAATSTPISRPTKQSQSPLFTQKKRKTQGPVKENTKRVKAGTEPPRPATSNQPKPARDVPQVRIDRKASMRRTSMDDSGELILENETPISEKPPKQPSAMSLALSGQLGGGPISLRSAASSPASRIASPMPPRPEGMDDGEEFAFGDVASSPESAKKPQKRKEEDYFGGGDDNEGETADADADADVEDLELPSPAQNRRKSLGGAALTGPADDDDDDLDKQLALAMAEDDDDADVPRAAPAESDEESEEE